MRPLPLVSIANGDTFSTWITKTNSGLSAFANTVTLAANSLGDSSTGNGFVLGIFGANTLVTSTIQGGNVNTNSSLTIAGNTITFSTSSISFGGLATNFAFTYTTSNTSAQLIDSFSTSTYAGGKYVISIKNNVNSDRHLTEILVMGSANSYMTEYASLFNNTTLGTFSSNVASSNVNIYFTPANANNTLTIDKRLIAA